MSGTIQFASVEDYLDSQPEQTKQALLEFKDCILKAEPNASELLNYNIPAYALLKGGEKGKSKL